MDWPYDTNGIANKILDLWDSLGDLTVQGKKIHRVQARRKRDFHGSAGGTFLRDYVPFPPARVLSFGDSLMSVSLHAHIYKNTVKR
jgi:hypothetical protein